MQDVLVVSECTTVPKTVKWIKELTLQAAAHPEIQRVAMEALQSKDVLKYIFDYSYDKIIYEPNEGKKQQLRTAWNFLRTGKGNCTSYTTLIGAALLNAGIPFKYRVVNYPEQKKDGSIIYPDEYQHIYIVTKDGTVLDPVIGHKQDGTDTRWNRPRTGQFNRELPFYKQIDFPMSRLEILQGSLGRTGNPQIKKLITNRSKMSRYGLLSGCGCSSSQENLNGLFSKIANVFVKKTPAYQAIEEVAPVRAEELAANASQMIEDSTKKAINTALNVANVATSIVGVKLPNIPLGQDAIDKITDVANTITNTGIIGDVTKFLSDNPGVSNLLSSQIKELIPSTTANLSDPAVLKDILSNDPAIAAKVIEQVKDTPEGPSVMSYIKSLFIKENGRSNWVRTML